MLVLQNTQGLNLELPGLHAEEQAEESATAKIDLLLALSEVDGKLVGTLEYSTDLFDRDRIERMLGHFRTLLEGIIASPDARLNAFPLLPQPERHQLLVEWSATHADTPRDRCVHQLFEEQVERSPQAIALVFGDQRLTYRELNARANQLARILHQQGVRPGDRVGLHVQRSVEMIVGLLAILKVGAAYLPLDPASPPERLRTILNEASPALVLCDERGGERVRQLPYPHRLLPSVSAVASAEDPGNFSSGATPQHLAYLMFTSGSTGQPKGIAVPHRAIVRLVCHPNYCHIGPEDTFLQFAPLAFDASTFEIWGCLLHGAQLVLFEGQAPDLQRLGAAIQAHQVSILWLTAGLFHTMIDTYPQGLRGVRQLLAGGDVVSPAHVRRALEELPGCRIVNGYGPTENTTFTCCHTVTSGSEIGASVPIGHPITDTRVYVLDSRMQPVPMGVAGELYTGGEGLAWGYVAHPEWTAERFVPDPFSEEAGARLYRTGDLVRWRSDGELEYLGRLDHQVKVRGFRIELGEIESALRSHPSVREAVVLAREDDPGERRLVAYMVSEQPGDLESAQLQRFLQCSLPDYMLPAAFVTLDALPLTSNGKVDRKALPAPGMKRPEELRGYVAPRTELETTLAGIWCEVLRLERVSVLDSFFDLGGHSLLAVRLFAQIERQLGARLPLSMLFEAPTIARFAARLGDGPTEACWRSLVAIQPCGERPPFFCVHGIGANLLNYRLLAGHLGVDQPFYGFQAQGLDGQQPAHTSLEAMAAHYIAELRTVQPTGPYRLGGGSAGGVVAFEMARQLQAQGENVALLVLIDTYLPIKADCTRNRSRLERLLRGADAHLGHLLLEDRTAVKSYIRHWGAEKLRSLRRGHRNGAHPAVDPELPLAMQQVIVANRAALSAYVPQPYQGRITQMLARKASDRTGEDGRLAWSALASEGLEVHYIAGDHDTMLEEPCVADLAAKLDSCLQRATLSNL
jgi:amino acid adenylation domain-containing protein